MNREDLVKKWLRGELTTSEREEFESAPENQLLKKIDDSLADFRAPEYQQSLHLESLSKKNALFSLKPFLKIAAVLILVSAVGIYFFLNDNQDYISVNALNQQQISLPDSSMVTLNAGSSIRYKGNNWHEERKVDLSGEGFFEVAEGSRFDVSTDNGVVSVLGTQFNVIARPQYFEVACYNGSVSVEIDQRPLVELQVGEAVRVLNGMLSRPAVIKKNETMPSWKKGESTFYQVTVKHILEELERQYQVKVISRDIDESLLFSGSFTNEDLTLALEVISVPLNCSFEIVEDQVKLFRRNTP